MSFPKVKHWGTFICELCTVRAVLDRPLQSPQDRTLLAFERMRILDMANAWAQKTHAAYQSKLGYIQNFESHFGLSCLPATPLRRPPDSADIALMWAQECYSLRRGRSGREPVVFGSIRPLRSAASQFLAWDTLLHTNGASYFDTGRRVFQGSCRLTDNLAYSLFSQGQATRIGDNPQPSTALLHRHVRWLDHDLRRRLSQARNLSHALTIAKAGFLNLVLWLGWLRSNEALSLRWCDIDVIHPRHGDREDFPPNMGALCLRLLPATKASRTRTADVVISYTCCSGLSIGWWWSQLLRLQGHPPQVSGRLHGHSDLIFVSSGLSPWSSWYYRTHFLYPALRSQQAEGNAYLYHFTGGDNALELKFWSLNSYRRGARTHSQRGGSFRKATQAQVYEHARWHRKRSSEAIDVMYRQWTLYERAIVTFFSF